MVSFKAIPRSSWVALTCLIARSCVVARTNVRHPILLGSGYVPALLFSGRSLSLVRLLCIGAVYSSRFALVSRLNVGCGSPLRG